MTRKRRRFTAEFKNVRRWRRRAAGRSWVEPLPPGLASRTPGVALALAPIGASAHEPLTWQPSAKTLVVFPVFYDLPE